MAALFVPGGNIGSLGDEGVDVGACIAIEGIDIGIGGAARVGGASIGLDTPLDSTYSIGSVCVVTDLHEDREADGKDTSSNDVSILGVAGGLRGGSLLWEDADVTNRGIGAGWGVPTDGLAIMADTRFFLWLASTSAPEEAPS